MTSETKEKPMRCQSERDRLALTCLPMVYQIARKFIKNRDWISEDEVVSAGMAGLLGAAEKWSEDDPSKTKFSSYAYNGIFLAVRTCVRGITRYREVIVNITEFSRDYSLEEIGEQVGAVNYDNLDQGLDAEFVRHMINRLPGRYRVVIEHRYGIGCDPKAQSAIAKLMGISKPRLQQLEQKAMDQLRSIACGETINARSAVVNRLVATVPDCGVDQG